MAPKLELWYPANNKPFQLNQAWGIYNPAYLKFGFDRHNGIDMPIAPDKAIYCPQASHVTAIAYFPEGGGHQIQLITNDKWNVNGVDCYVLFVFMHNETILAKLNDVCGVGVKLTVPDNTGFSTGPHTHFGCYRLNDDLSLMDKNEENGSFDPMPFFNGKYASDYQALETVIETATQIIPQITTSNIPLQMKLDFFSKVAQLLTTILNVFKLE